MVQGVKVGVLESTLTMDWSAGQELGRLSKLLGRNSLAGIPTAIERAEDGSDEVTVVVVSTWDARPAGDVTTAAMVEGVEVVEKYLDSKTDINGTVEEELVAAAEELIAALWAAWYLAARALSLACLFQDFLLLGLDMWVVMMLLGREVTLLWMTQSVAQLKFSLTIVHMEAYPSLA